MGITYRAFTSGSSRGLSSLSTTSPVTTKPYREFAIKGVFRSVPVDLHGYFPTAKSSLIEVDSEVEGKMEILASTKASHRSEKKILKLEALMGTISDYAVVTRKGLVYPLVKTPDDGAPACRYSNGAIFYANSRLFFNYARYLHMRFFWGPTFRQKLERTDGIKSRRHGPTDFIFILRRGTPIPDDLSLFQEHEAGDMARFSLQPSRGMKVKDLNEALDEFYSEHAVIEPVSKYLERGFIKETRRAVGTSVVDLEEKSRNSGCAILESGST